MACLNFCDRCGKQIDRFVPLGKYSIQRYVRSTASKACWTQNIKLCERCRDEVDYVLDELFKDCPDRVTGFISKEMEQISIKEDM